MRKINSFILPSFLVLVVIAIIGCQQEGLNVPTELTHEQIHGEHYAVSLSDIERTQFEFPDGTSEERYIVEGDIAFSEEEFNEMLEETNGGLDFRQYRTSRICNNGTYRVLGYTGGGNGLSNRMKNALNAAVKNYNNLNLGIKFTLDFGTNYNAYDMVVYQVGGFTGGIAGFPYSNGKPYKWIQIGSGMNNHNFNTNEHVITHEMGHAVGLRHTDWFYRCDGTNEGSAGVGAHYIPGTSGMDYNSIMISCFQGDENGEFSWNDIKALRELY